MVERVPPLSPSGSTVSVVHTQREMNCYALFDSDLESLGTLNTVQSTCVGIASFTAALWLDLFKDSQLAGSVPPIAQEMLTVVQPILGVATVIAIMVALVFGLKKRSKLQQIKSQSKVVTSQGV
ncbi:hypothetical protein [Allosphingosinicella indica]|uniref:hypothetical protein n=1 Tax=Allosphingosinicella indica TaxID=941907 RepID=UPI0012F4BE62|nr:hypothetical protein [Allosphingosinicella indica]